MMAKENQHDHNHSNLLAVMVVAVVLLTIGQFVLYRNLQHVKSMISETSMELKEGKGVKKDAVFMRDGKMMKREDGVEELMDEAETLDDGTKVMMDGTVLKKDGTTMKMTEGNELMMDNDDDE